MTTDALIEFIRVNWLVLLTIIIMTGYTAFSYIRIRITRSSLIKKKEALEKELDELNAQFAQNTKLLEEELNRKDEILKKG